MTPFLQCRIFRKDSGISKKLWQPGRNCLPCFETLMARNDASAEERTLEKSVRELRDISSFGVFGA
jgi:hypothetical protein